jgi:hypothetical protein
VYSEVVNLHNLSFSEYSTVLAEIVPFCVLGFRASKHIIHVKNVLTDMFLAEKIEGNAEEANL